ncbi:MAG: PD-(D/E)XK nuclease family protein [Bryobacteraceae bacterium]|nr:PD-(D/E)XK nuclease family protein [Bryobacteraceae bacterium]
MILLSGPPGSGKTSRVLSLVRGHLERRESHFRLLVPTATLAEHFRNVLAREGFAFRPGLVLTLSKFIEPFTRSAPPPPALLELVLERVLERQRHTEFAGVSGTVGFLESLASAIDEFSTAGTDAASLAGVLSGPYASAFLAVFRSVEEELATRGYALRGPRLREAAEAVGGLSGIGHLYLDGFVSFAALEIEFLKRCPAQVTLTLPEWDGNQQARAALAAAETVRMRGAAPAPAETVVAAPNLELEVDEVARRVLAAGRPFHEIGVIVRQPRVYVPALRAAFERFGIPARFYFSDPLAANGTVQYLSTLCEAAATGWPLDSLAVAFSHPASGIGGTPEGDWLNVRLREAMPAQGLSAARKAAESKGTVLFRFLEQFDKPLGSMRVAAEWAEHLAKMPGAVSMGQPQDGRPHEVELWRSRALALRGFVEAVRETALALGAETLLPFPDFWRQVRRTLELTPLRTPDRRRAVVHVMDAWEARQWRLPLVFVCGMLEGQFPAYPAQDPLFPDAVRLKLRKAGVPVKTLAERQQEEEFLWTMARTRADEALVLSYPKFNARGEETLASFWLAGAPEAQEAVAARPAAGRARAAAARAVLYDETLLQRMGEKFVSFSPSAIETFLTCPYQFFARHTLRLRELPARPEERLDRLSQGNLVHDVLSEWHRSGRAIKNIFEERFADYCREANVKQGFATEVARLEMLRNLEAFECDPRLLGGVKIETEQKFEFELAEGIRIRGRIDRIDHLGGGRVRLCDYKYSSMLNVKKRFSEENLDRYVQGGLYVLALAAQGQAVERFDYCGLRGGVNWKGYEGEALTAHMQQAKELTVEAVSRVRAGAIGLEPADRDACRTCDYADACRVKSLPARVRGAGGGE